MAQREATALAVRTNGNVMPFEPQNIDEAMRLAGTLGKSALVPSTLRGKPEDVLVVLLTGRELGFGPMQSLRLINVIQGKGVLSADGMVALCQARPDICEYFSMIETTPTTAAYETKRKGAPSPVRMTYTLEQAKRANLVGKDNWRMHPEAMLRARCASALARAAYPDLVAGLYNEDEAKEIQGREPDHQDTPPLDPAQEIQAPEPQVPAQKVRGISRGQAIFEAADARALDLGLPPDAGQKIVAQVYEHLGISGTKAISGEDQYNQVIELVRNWGAPIEPPTVETAEVVE